MADTLALSCPECEKPVKVPAELAGKKIKCKGCGHVFLVKARSSTKPAKAKSTDKPAKGKAGIQTKPTTKGKGRPADEEEAIPLAAAAEDEETIPIAAVQDEDEEGSNPYGVTAMDLAPRCPACAGELESRDAVICLKCGYNLETREVHKIVKTIDHTVGDYILWLLPGAVCVIVGILLILSWIYYYFILPPDLFPKWYEALEKAEGSRRKAIGELEDFSAYLFHPAIGVILGVIVAFLVWSCFKFAFLRLVLHYRPPEKFAKKL